MSGAISYASNWLQLLTVQPETGYGVATMSRRLKIICLFCRISSLLRALLQKRPIILRSLLIVATLLQDRACIIESELAYLGLSAHHTKIQNYYCNRRQKLLNFRYFWNAAALTFEIYWLAYAWGKKWSILVWPIITCSLKVRVFLLSGPNWICTIPWKQRSGADYFMPQSYWSLTTNRIEKSQDLFNQNNLIFLVVNRNQTFTYQDLFVTGTPSSMSFEKPVKPENRADSGRIMIRHFQITFLVMVFNWNHKYRSTSVVCLMILWTSIDTACVQMFQALLGIFDEV